MNFFYDRVTSNWYHKQFGLGWVWQPYISDLNPYDNVMVIPEGVCHQKESAYSWRSEGRNHSCIKSIPNWLSYEKFNLTFANGVGCIGINLNMILFEWNLPCFIRVVVSEPVLWVRYINKYRHLKQLCSFSLNPVYFVV